VLWGSQFIGRIEAAADRKTGMLAVKNVWYENGVRQTKKLASALDGAIARLAKLNGMEQVCFDRPENSKRGTGRRCADCI
jgi:uncharacterized protein YcaQ